MPFLDLPKQNMRLHYVVNTLKAQSDAELHTINPDKKILVLIHASGSTVDHFAAQFADARLTSKYNLVAFDAPLHGKSGGDERAKLTLEDSANCILEGISLLQIQSYGVVGEGFHGCNIATWLALKSPEMVTAVVLASPCPLIEPEDVQFELNDEWLPEAVKHKDGKGDGSGTIPEEQMQVVADYYFGRMKRAEDRREKFLAHFQARYGTGCSSHDISLIVNWFKREPIPASLLASVKAPVLILHGGDDNGASSLSAAEGWKNSFKSSRGGADLRVIAGAPHFLSYTDYSIADRFILQFMERA
ncbi:hypothetical protein MNV49_006134 [Pseudohyphozyma bogoriensis]|nr:hypothetical protein MNV49_006134 [Pseudohyphozyma bogoriensis]